MFWDIVIVAVVALTQLFVTIYAVWVSVNENKRRIAFVIAFVGAIGIGLTVWGAIRNGMSQERLQGDIAELKKGQQTANAGIQQIQKSSPPVINVPAPVVNITSPPTATPSAAVVLTRYESSYNSMIPGGSTTHPLLVVGQPVKENFHFSNMGSARAEGVGSLARVYVTPDDEESVISKFKTLEKQAEKQDETNPPKGNIEVGGIDDFWFTATSERALTSDDMQDLVAAKEHLYMLFSLVYRDPIGKHRIHWCQILQPPTGNGDAIWYSCKDWTDRH